MAELTDDEAIVTAALLGLITHRGRARSELWYSYDERGDHRLDFNRWRDLRSSIVGCSSQAEIAREWIKFIEETTTPEEK